MNNKNLIIIGASGHGKVAAEIAELTNTYQDIFFMDDFSDAEYFYDYSNLGSTDKLIQYKQDYDVFVAIGDNQIRKRIMKKLFKEGFNIPTLIHPSATISKTCKIEKGSIIMAGAILNPCVKIGKGTIINTNSNCDHDTIIGNYSHISPGVSIAGTSKLGNGIWLGTNASVTNNITICDDVTVGAGGVVVKDIIEFGTYVGVPVTKIS